jgi:hypothetical protein
MATPKALVIICIAALLGCLLFFEAANGRVIGYEPLKKGKFYKCKGGQCLPPPSNPYGRGCENVEKCRVPPATAKRLKRKS